MNKKLLTAFLFGASVLASTSTFVSCKDYDDDIKNVQNNLDAEVSARKALEEKVATAQAAINALQSHETECDAAQAKALEEAKAALEKAIKQNADDIVKANAKVDQALIDAKAYTDAAIALQADKDAKTYATITDVNKQITDVLGKYQTLSDEIAAVKGEYGSLKAALDAQKAALEEELKKGDDATLKAAKEAIEAAKKELEEKEAECDKKIDAKLTEIYKAFDAENGTLDGLKTAISNMQVDIANLKNYADELKTKTIPAIEEEIGTVSEALKIMSQILSSQLRSLVFMPYLYVDGIEATRYRVLVDTVLEKSQNITCWRTRSEYEKTIGCTVGTPDAGTTTKYKLSNFYDWVEPTTKPKLVFYGPTWPVDYHANPTSANVQFSEVKGFKVLTPEVITRAADPGTLLGVTAEEKYPNGEMIFNNNRNGELVVGIKVANPSYLFDNDPYAVVNQNPDLANNYWNCPSCNTKNSVAEDVTCTKCGKVYNYESGTGHYSYGKDNTVALQVYEDDYTTSSITKDTITSDYALLYGTKVFLDGIVWNKNVGTVGDSKLEGKGYASPYSCVAGYSRQEDTDEWYYNAYGLKVEGMVETEAHSDYIATNGKKYRCGQHRHVYDTPQEALYDKNPVMLYWNDQEGIKLEDYLALHWYEENVNRTGWNSIYETNFTDKKSDSNGAGNPWKQYGLTYDFEFCNYRVGDNLTSDSKYAYWKDNAEKLNSDLKDMDGYFSETGTIIAGSVDESGEFDSRNDYGTRLTAQNKQTVHREPLVRVRVKKGDDILLDGYILVHITDKIIEEEQKTVEINAANETKFDLCNDAKALAFDWADFTKIVLQGAFKELNPDGISKTTFDEWFGGDENQIISTGAKADFGGAADGDWSNAVVETNGGYSYDCDLYASNSKTAKANVGTYGRVRYYLNESGTTNNEFVWYLTAEEMEEITHHSADGKGTATVYIRWTGKASSPYSYLFAKLTVTVTREEIIKYGLAEKDINYWYCAKNGSVTKEDDPESCEAKTATLFNVESPKDGSNTQAFVVKQLNNWVGNEIFLVNAATKKLAVSGSANLSTQTHSITATTANGEATKSSVVKKAKFYFTPDTMKVVVPSETYKPNTGSANFVGDKVHNEKTTPAGTVYYITPQRSAADKEWNALIPRYYTHKLAASTSYFTAHDELTTTPAFPTCKLDKTIHYYNRAANAYTKENEQDFEAFENEWNKKCAIDYTAGAYTNKDLYATTDFKTFYKIAEMDQETGVLTLIHYDETDAEYRVVCDVLNAVGYDNNSTSHHANNVNRELRAKIGIIATDKCDLATQMENSTWLGSWERPLNIEPVADDKVIDANQKDNANFIYLADILKVYDWRGPVKGEMSSREKRWLWAYYNIHYITVDCTPSVVTTNLHIEGEKIVATSGDVKTWTPLSKIDPKYVRLFPDSMQTAVKKTFNFDLVGKSRYDKAVYEGKGHFDPKAPLANVLSNIQYERNFNCAHKDYPGYHDINNSSWSKCGNAGRTDFDFASRSSELYDIMTSPKYTYVNKTGIKNHDGSEYLEDVKAKFGYIWYDNNLDNVSEFWVKVPITIGYEWGCVTENVAIKIYPTEGNTGSGEYPAKKRAAKK